MTGKSNDRLRGVSRMASLEIILEKAERSYSPEEKERLCEKKNRMYRELLFQMSEKDLPADVQDVLRTLKKAGIRIAIGSSSKNTKLILERLGLENCFDAVSDGTNITHSKPDPEVFLKAAEMLGLSPEKCLVVEDAKAGVTAATRGGMDSAGIGEAAETATWPMQSIEELKKIVLL